MSVYISYINDSNSKRGFKGRKTYPPCIATGVGRASSSHLYIHIPATRYSTLLLSCLQFCFRVMTSFGLNQVVWVYRYYLIHLRGVCQNSTCVRLPNDKNSIEHNITLLFAALLANIGCTSLRATVVYVVPCTQFPGFVRKERRVRSRILKLYCGMGQ